MLSDDGITMSNTHEWCAEGISSESGNLQSAPISEFPWWMSQLQNHENIYIPRVASLPPEAQNEKSLLLAQGIQSVLIVPMIAEYKLIGFIGFDAVHRQREWSEDNIVILESVASIITKGLQRKTHTEALQASENNYRTIFENTGAPTMIIEENMTISMINSQYGKCLQYEKEYLLGKKLTDIIPLDFVEQITDFHTQRRIEPNTVPIQYDIKIIDGNDQVRDGLMQVALIPDTKRSVATFIDMTECRRTDRALKAISAINSAIVHADKEQELLDLVCHNFVEIGGYSMAWIGYVTDTPELKIKPVADAGHNHGYTNKLNIALKNSKRSRGPVGSAIRSNLPQVCRDIKTDLSFKPWAKDALRRGYKACMVLPLTEDENAFGVVGIYSSEKGVFNHAEKWLLAGMSENLSYAITSLRARSNTKQTTIALEKSLEKMRKLLLQSVSSLGRALDVKDPYTFTHQKKVVLLATAIARELGLTPDRIEAIEVAGNLHDIGKIYVPSEILNKPGKLTPIEFELIKTHPQAGYEIIKDIDFPWSVGEILLQHHERLDGSGYPRGLIGEEILLEAQIIAVADVVEAMSSPRPYRPALGIDSALAEIKQNRARLYNSEAVEACIRLFKENDFTFE